MLLVLWLCLFDIVVVAVIAQSVYRCCDFQFDPLPVALRGLNQFIRISSKDVFF